MISRIHFLRIYHLCVYLFCISSFLSSCGGVSSNQLDSQCTEVISCGVVHLLVDEELFQSTDGLSRSLTTMVKNSETPLIKDERFYGNALKIDNIFRLYVLGGRVYESLDGMNFLRGNDLKGLTLDPAESSVTVTQYTPMNGGKPIYLAAYPDFSVKANIAFSNDGLLFYPLNDEKPVTGRAADTHNQLMFDPLKKNFRLSTRTDFGDWGGPGEVRGTRTMVNNDIFNSPTNWTTISEWALSPEYASSEKQIYGKTEFIERGVYFSLAMVFKHVGDLSEGGVDYFARHDRDIIDVHLLTSRDGVTWDKYWISKDKPLLIRGKSGSFDKDLIVPAAQIITTADEHILYYSGANERHGVSSRSWGISRATVKRDRFVCQASEDGSATFKPLAVQQSFLGLNLDTSNGEATFWFTNANGRTYGPISVSGVDGEIRIPYSQFKSIDLEKLNPVAGDLLTLKIRLVKSRLCAVSL